MKYLAECIYDNIPKLIKSITVFLVIMLTGLFFVCSKAYADSIPVMYINTENGAPIESKDEYINAEMKLQGNDTYKLSSQLYSGDIQIRGRGNSTWKLAKKPYKIKLNSKSGLLGMPKSKHWVLIANYFDESLMRNKLAYDLSGEMGMPYMKSTWVDVVLNGQKIGNYQLCEQIRVDDNRVDIYDWEETASDIAKKIYNTNGLTTVERDEIETLLQTDFMWTTDDHFTYKDKEYTISDYVDLPNITGGYLVEADLYWDGISKFKTEQLKRINISAPEYIKTNKSMFDYVQNYIQAFENACISPNFLTQYDGETVHYSDLADMQSMIDFWLVHDVLFANCEFENKSTFMYKDIDGLLYFGPVWDMDYSSNSFQNRVSVDKLYGNDISNIDNQYAAKWYPRLLKDPYFVVKARERIEEILPKYVVPIYQENGLISTYNNYLYESGTANTELWKYRRGYVNDVAVLTKWFADRTEWIENTFTTNENSINALGLYKKDENIDTNVTFSKDEAKVLNGDLISDMSNDNMVDFDNLESGDSKGYIYNADSFYVNVYDRSKTDTMIELYINGHFEASISNSGFVQFLVNKDVLTEEKGTQNVFVIRTKNADGEYMGSNYITVVDKSGDEPPTRPTETPEPPVYTVSPPKATPETSKTHNPPVTTTLPIVTTVPPAATTVPPVTTSEPSSSPVMPTGSSVPPLFTLAPTNAPNVRTQIPLVTPAPTAISNTTEDRIQATATTNAKNTYVITDNSIETIRNNVKYKIIDTKNKTVKVTGVIKKNIKSVVIPAEITIKDIKYKVTVIASSSFKSCKKLKKAVIGNNVKSIGSRAFMNCKLLKNITVKSSNINSIIKSSFNNINKNAVIRVPKSKLLSYRKKFSFLASIMKH